MKPSALFTTAIFATSASAIGPASPGAAPQAARPAGKPGPTENWKWASTSPFKSAALKTKFAPWTCAAEQTFRAREFLLDDLSELPPLGIKPFREALKLVFADRQYPGSWDGIDPHGYDRDLLVMEYAQVPRRVRAWIEEQERSEGKGKGLFAVYEKPVGEAEPRSTVAFGKKNEDEDPKADEGRVVIFAPGALWEVLPLWVAEESACPGKFLFCRFVSTGTGFAVDCDHHLDGRRMLTRGVLQMSSLTSPSTAPSWLTARSSRGPSTRPRRTARREREISSSPSGHRCWPLCRRRVPRRMSFE
ncbi:hypothetical protein B0T19DRAFT_416114 [Cercophora scortea]|uniref:Uncharacterized protein n=1 Tax=Cercophora scortea TaxID=314031 RepID=A0AAE0IWJ5_9PEZI|nr:hypothetical protein B0T19DRAFT_416114 [Cercophora scortea]